MKKPSHPVAKLLILGGFLVFLSFWVYMDLPCVFRSITGIPCIGCGLSRAWLAALHLDISGAFFYHPMFWSIPVLLLLVFFDGRLFSRPLWNGILIGVITAGFFLCYFIRIVGYLSGFSAI